MLFQLATTMKARNVPNAQERLREEIDRLAEGHGNSERVLDRVARHYNDTRATHGFIQMLEGLGLRGRAIGEFHFVACGANDHLFRIVIANESTGVTTFGVSQHDTMAKLRALAEVLKQDETTQKMKQHIG